MSNFSSDFKLRAIALQMSNSCGREPWAIVLQMSYALLAPSWHCLLAILALSFYPAFAASSENEKKTQAPAEDFEQIDEGEDKIRTMTLQEAKVYLLSLINKDRAEFHLPPVELDEKASEAAQFHAYDTALRAYNDHYDPEGRSPDWRYSLLGGTQLAMENELGAVCDPSYKYRIARRQRFAKQEIESIETAFFDEKPPKDGHRKNILRPRHNKVGLGLTSYVYERPSTEQSLKVTCCEEFVDSIGTFPPRSLSAKRGEVLNVEGKLNPGFSVSSVDVLRDDLPRSRKLSTLQRNEYGSYSLPDERVTTLFPANITHDTNGGFKAQIPILASWKDGLFYLNVWVTDGKDKDFVASRQIVAVGAEPTKLELSAEMLGKF